MDWKLIVRLILIWLVASLVITTWVALNVVVIITPFWLDTIMGIALIISLIPVMVRPSAWLRERWFGRWLSWILVGGAILFGVTYASLSFVSNHEAYPFVYVLAIEQPLFQSIEQIYWAYSIGEQVSLSTGIQFSLFSLIMGMLLLTMAGAAQIVWPALASYPSLINRLLFYRRQKLATKIHTPPTRAYRWSGHQKRLIQTSLLILLLVGLGLFGGAILANNLLPKLQWQNHPIEISSNVTVNTLLALGNGRLLAGTDYNGMFRSEDGGQSWQAANAGLSSTFIKVLMVEPGGNRLFAGTGSGVFRSDDGGQSWQATNSDLTANTFVMALVVEPGGDRLFAGTFPNGVLRSEDGGQSWQATNTGLIGSDVRALVKEPDRDRLFVGTLDAGVFRSEDGGQSWQAANTGLPGTTIKVLMVEPGGDRLFAGTFSNGVFRSEDGGQSWQATNAGLPTNTFVNALVVEPGGDRLFAGMDGGVFRSEDGGQSWQAANAGLTANIFVNALVVEPGGDRLFAGTQWGVFRSEDGGQSWQAANVGLTDPSIKALVVEPDGDRLFVGTNGGGVFRSEDGGQSWQTANTGLTNPYINALVGELGGDCLFAGTDGGVFRSEDDGQSWQAANTGLTNPNVRALVMDQGGNRLFAGTDGGVFRSEDGGQTWQAANTGLTNPNVRALVMDQGGNRLFAGTYGDGVFRSEDGGQSWQTANTGLTDTYVVTLMMDPGGNHLFAKGDSLFVKPGESRVFRSEDGGQSWSKIYVPLDLELLEGEMGTPTMFYIPSNGHLATLAPLTGDLIPLSRTPSLRLIAVRPVSDNEVEIITIWGITLGRARMDLGTYKNSPTLWLALRGWAWRWSYFWQDNRMTIGLIAGVVLLLTAMTTYSLTYAAWAAPYGLSVRRFLAIFPWRLARLANEIDSARLSQIWPNWRSLIRCYTLWWGEASPVDLRTIPWPYRRWALYQYLAEHQTSQPLDMHQDNLRLLAGGRPAAWLKAWRDCAIEMGDAPGLTTSGRQVIDRLALPLVEALGGQLGPAQDWGAIRAYSLTVPTLRLNVPPRFPLIFLAYPRPDAKAVKLLTDCVDVLRETGYFALIVLLQPTQPAVDIPAELRRWLQASPRVNDFIILTLENVLDLLSARDPVANLVQLIVSQINLKTISPFVDSGPCPPAMFFGREREIRQIVEGIDRGDFAVVGNRKAGKTSLLQQTQARLTDDGRFRPILVNCQGIPTPAAFYQGFEAAGQLTLSACTPAAFELAIRDLAQNGLKPILLLDEVDDLLQADAQAGEVLVGTWRKLAQESVCHFVFVGTTGLARSLRNPHSVFFNFPQRLPLKYLPVEVARVVITQPLAMLGLILQPHTEVVDYIVDLASGHPNLLQTLGRRLVERASEAQTREITLDDCQAVARDNDFINFYLDVIWGVARPLEKLITLAAPAEKFELQDLDMALAKYGINCAPEEMNDALEMLKIYAILKQEEKCFSFNPTRFREILQRTQDINRLITIEKRKL